MGTVGDHFLRRGDFFTDETGTHPLRDGDSYDPSKAGETAKGGKGGGSKGPAAHEEVLMHDGGHSVEEIKAAYDTYHEGLRAGDAEHYGAKIKDAQDNITKLEGQLKGLKGKEARGVRAQIEYHKGTVDLANRALDRPHTPASEGLVKGSLIPNARNIGKELRDKYYGAASQLREGGRAGGKAASGVMAYEGAPNGSALGYVQKMEGGKYMAHHFATGGRSGHETQAGAHAAVVAMDREHKASGAAGKFQQPADFFR